MLAPDLIGHGDSAAPRGDYSLGAHAASIRDLMAAIGIDRATIVGHSLGGGVAMQFFYQFPQRVERLVLISSGGLGHEVSPMLRTAALPGVSLAALGDPARGCSARCGRRAGACANADVRAGVYLQAIARALRPLENAGARAAFLHTLRSVIDVQGQRVSATDRLYLLESIPTMIVWGERDHTIPIEHGRARAPGDPAQPLPDAPRRRPLPPPRGPGRAVAAAARVPAEHPAGADRGRRLGRAARPALAAHAPARRRGGLTAAHARQLRSAATARSGRRPAARPADRAAA